MIDVYDYDEYHDYYDDIVDNQDRTWSLDWRTVACSPACSYPGDYNSYFHRPQIHGIYSGSSQYFFKSIKVVLFLGAAIAGSINPVKFYYDIGETRHTFSYFHVEKTPKMFCTGDTVSYTCNVGYLLQGSAVLKCRKGGRSICFFNCSPERHLAFKYLKP